MNDIVTGGFVSWVEQAHFHLETPFEDFLSEGVEESEDL